MVAEQFPASSLHQEGLGRVIAAWTLKTSIARLVSLLLTTVAGALALRLLAERYWPVAAIVGTVSCIAAWGLLAQHAVRHPATWVAWVQRILIVVGVVLTALAGLSVFFALLGPHAWTL